MVGGMCLFTNNSLRAACWNSWGRLLFSTKQGGQEPLLLHVDASPHNMSGTSRGKDIFLACPFLSSLVIWGSSPAVTVSNLIKSWQIVVNAWQLKLDKIIYKHYSKEGCPSCWWLFWRHWICCQRLEIYYSVLKCSHHYLIFVSEFSVSFLFHFKKKYASGRIVWDGRLADFMPSNVENSEEKIEISLA